MTTAHSHEPLPVIGRSCSGCMYYCRWLCCGKVYCRECFIQHAPGVAYEAELAYLKFLDQTTQAERDELGDERFLAHYRRMLSGVVR